jgi:thiol:disulfide interchange protein DsbD
MDQITFRDERVQARLKAVLLLRADVTANSADDQALLRRFDLFGPPGIIFFDEQGAEVRPRIVGYQAPDRFLRSLDRGRIALAAP